MQPIKSLKDIQIQKEVLMTLRKKQLAGFDKIFSVVTSPLSMATLIFKPLLNRFSWISIAINIGKIVFRLLKSRKN